MCLITTQQEPLIAEEDIITYKVISNSLQSCFTDVTVFQYALKELYETTIEESANWSAFDKKDYNKIIEYVNSKEPMAYFETKIMEKYLKCFGQGFHSALTKGRLMDGNVMNGVQTLVKCIIPKGSEYYTNPSGLVISNKLFIDEKIYYGNSI